MLRYAVIYWPSVIIAIDTDHPPKVTFMPEFWYKCNYDIQQSDNINKEIN